jgi:NUMOD4 motif
VVRLVNEEKDEEAEAIYAPIRSELGYAKSSALLEFIEDRQKNSVAPASVAPTKPRRGVLKPARRTAVSKSTETWRCLGLYPAYEISSYGRVRSLDRAKPGDWLKPRYRWFKGLCVASVVIKDSDGRRCERMIGVLLIAAGFMLKPAWMKK